MKRIVIFTSIVLIACVSVLTWLYLRDRETTIPDVTKPVSLALKKRPSQGYIHYLELEISGSITGSAEVTLVLEGKPYRSATVSGRVQQHWDGECYSDEVEIRYAPAGVTGGSLAVFYRFRD